MSERTRLRIQAGEMGFLQGGAGLSLTDRLRASVIVEPHPNQPVGVVHGRLLGQEFPTRPTGIKPGHRIQQSHKEPEEEEISAGKSDVSGHVGNKWKVGYSYTSMCPCCECRLSELS